MLRTLFKLPEFISYEYILSQYNLNTIKHRRLVLAFILEFLGYPNYISDMFSVRNCANNLCGTRSRVNQPTSKTALKHKSFLMLLSDSRIIYRLMLGRPLI